MAQSDAPVTTGRYVRRIIDREDGLPETQVNAIARTPDGYLWLGTRRGLVRYDGLTVTTFTPETDRAVPDYWINGLTVDRQGQLWIATPRGLAIRSRAGQFTRIDTTALPATDVWRAFEDGRGRLWVATTDGAWRREGSRFVRVPGTDGYVYAIAEDARGRLWMSGRGLLVWTDGRVTVDVAGPLRLSGRFFDVIRDDRAMLVATAEGALRFDGTADRPRALGRVSTRLGAMRRPVWALARSPDGRLWLGTENAGTLQWDGSELHAMSPGPRETWSFFVDPRGIVWAGTGAGLERHEPSAFELITAGLPASSVWSVRLDGAGTMWAATGDGALHRWNGTRFDLRFPSGEAGISSPTWPSGDGLLAALGSRRLVTIDAQGTARPAPAAGLPDGEILGLLDDGRGGWWLAADSGLLHLAHGRVERRSASIGLPSGTRPREMARDAQGRTLFGRPWLTVLDPGGRARRYGPAQGLTDSLVHALLPRGEFTWIGTADSGLFVLHRDRVHALGRLAPVLRGQIVALADDGVGYLWVISPYQLTRIAASDLEGVVQGTRSAIAVREFDYADGLPSAAFLGDFQSRIAQDREGRLLIPNTAGVVRVDPRRLPDDAIPPQVVMESILADGTAQPLDSVRSLPSGTARVELHFAVTDALRPVRTRVQYRMLGLDSTWVDAGTRRVASFGPLPGGIYRFEVRAASGDGHWTPTPAAVTLNVRKALPEYRWFLPLIVLCTAGGVLLVGRARRRALEERGLQLSRMVDERTRDLETARLTLEKRVEERTAQLAGELAERARLEQALVQAQKLEGIGRLAGGVAHEINNSMTSVLGFTDYAVDLARGNESLLDELREVRRGAERVVTITRQLLLFARLEHHVPTRCAPGEIVSALRRTLQQVVGDDVVFTVTIDEGVPPVHVDRGQIEQMLLNLVRNARDATPRGGTVSVHVAARTLAAPTTVGGTPLPAGAYAVLSVRDTGVGMRQDVRQRIFEPFFTTKDAARGTGLGLAVCHGIVANHRGTIDVDSAPGAGTRFDVWLPADSGDPLAPTHARAGTAASTPGQGETILVVDDERSVRELVRRHLVGHGYRVLLASDAPEALAHLAVAGSTVDLLLTDYMMPDVTGMEVAQRARRLLPELPVVFMSGFSGLDRATDDALASVGAVIGKPFTRSELLATIQAGLTRARTTAPPG